MRTTIDLPIDSRKLVHVKIPKFVNSRKLIQTKNLFFYYFSLYFFKIFIRMQLILWSTKASISMTVNLVFNQFIFFFQKTIIYCYFLSLTIFLFVFGGLLLFFLWTCSQVFFKDFVCFLGTPI